ncbi:MULTISPECIES: hypothetical protein [unclassified Lactococcus]|uniref:hypothetical protein n=1 Tax=unclassified Lactococcus TaxID=2643510 RepID=UPI0011C97A84|nr:MULTISPECIES: hypothetical protein [unclassified Lactococcus]MQW21994.1 hypothetical protein [Lactococcus sp. dk101]TXK36825.1 hypothetical protein FVP42_10640 [Lactococcus sp. dk310]TXK47477.1 hypothetical protein FVP43_10200 [Lactococcus sp. dk322]
MELDYIKTFCQIPQEVTIYNENLELLRSQALGVLTVAGVSTDETNSTVKGFISTYCRLYYLPEPTKNFTEIEQKRLQVFINLLTYGGTDDVQG